MSGPLSGIRDDVIQGESGIAAMIGRRTGVGEPRYIPMVIADKFCGHVLASAIGMALYARERTGKGQEVVVPMLETMLSFNLVEHLWTNFFEDDRENLGYFFHRYEHPSEGAMVTTAIPVHFGATPPSIRLTPPALGEHTASVLRDCGYSEAEISALR